ESGEVIAADLVLVGIGASPNVELATAAGLDCDNGICVNEICQTEDANIFAAGDCSNFTRDGRHIRLESVQNAADQGDLIARVLAGEDVTYTALPWFWSDQYDCKLQIVGLNLGHDQTVVRHGASESSMSVWYYRGERLLAVDAMNDPRAYAFGSKMIEAGKNPTQQQVADPATDLKALATA
ncbi:MAG: FAD-dependent oxidoreductase, partial [Gammaproteobacteria bacterium]|nr:FAD-dependent oxidoreductase [Gammaproteobacteria bacterium]